MSLRWGIVSTGAISSVLVDEIRRTEGCDVVAVCSRSPERARRFADERRIPRAYGSVEELVADDEVDVVYVGSTHQHHPVAARAALEAGLPVLCEKPFTVTAAQTDELVALARRRGVFLMEAMWMRCLPGFRRLVELVRSGELGAVRHVQASLGAPPPAERVYRFADPELGGGSLLDTGVYPLTFAFALLGTPDRVAATAVLEGGVDTATSVSLAWDLPATATLACSTLAALPADATVVFEQGSVHVPASMNRPSGFAIARTGAEPEWVDVPFRGRGYVHEVQEVRRCLEAGLTESPLVPLDDTVEVMRLLDRVRAEIGLRYPADA
jgi:predicted dehydrogenase